jgi:LmbE family N-acetylglucosaminyl deacetylase
MKTKNAENNLKNTERKESILVICAHSDDQIFGLGGTLAKYAREGKEIHTIIFSFGERTHPHYKPEIIKKIRVQESQKADKIIGGQGVIFLGLREGKFLEDFHQGSIRKNLIRLIRKFNPDKIFTHSSDDVHEDHRAVNKIVLEIYDTIHCRAKVLTFDIWNFFSLKEHDTPKLIVDISDTFNIKIKALKSFETQVNFFSYMILNNILYLSMCIKTFLRGVKNDCRFAEVFRIVR